MLLNTRVVLSLKHFEALVHNTRVTILLTITSVPSGTIALTSSGMTIRLLRYVLEEQTTALSMAPVG